MSHQIRSEADARYPQYVRGERDYKAWAKRIVYRHEKKDNSLFHIQIPLAYAALGMEVPKDPQAI